MSQVVLQPRPCMSSTKLYILPFVYHPDWPLSENIG